MEIREPEIVRKQIMETTDEAFTPENVCIVSGSGTGIGRAVANRRRRQQPDDRWA